MREALTSAATDSPRARRSESWPDGLEPGLGEIVQVLRPLDAGLDRAPPLTLLERQRQIVVGSVSSSFP